VHGSFNDITALDFMQVQLDLQYRKEWDNMSVDLDIFDSEPLTHSDLIYWEFRWPVIIICRKLYYRNFYMCKFIRIHKFPYQKENQNFLEVFEVITMTKIQIRI